MTPACCSFVLDGLRELPGAFQRLVERYWPRPSWYRGEPFGFAKNQLFGHAPLGYVAFELGWWGVPVVAVYFLVIELPQIVYLDGEILDSIEDAAFVAYGAFAGPALLVVAVAHTMVGAIWRWHQS